MQDQDDLVLVIAPADAPTAMNEDGSEQAARDQAEYDQASEQLMTGDGAPIGNFSALGQVMLAEFRQAEMDRRPTEERWLKDLRQFKGLYDPEVLALIGPDRSRAFVRKTRVKVKTVDSRVMDLKFPAGGKSWTIDPTPEPTLSEEQKAEILGLLKGQAKQAHMAAMQEMQAQAQAQAEQSGQSAPTAEMPPVPEVTPEQIRQAALELAKQSAKRMTTVCEDQMVEANFKGVVKQALHSGHLYGTGIIKGPLVERRVRTQYTKENGRWVHKSIQYIRPFVDFVPLWRFYPDMSASRLEDCRYAFECHRMTHASMSELASRKSFRRDVIAAYLLAHPAGQVMLSQVDTELKSMGDRSSKQADPGGMFDVLERWGYLTGTQLREAGVNVPDDRLHETFFSNVWLLPTGEVIKAVLQPINGVLWPYHIYYFDKDETSIFGEGLAAILRDDQTMINAGTRMILDNAALTSFPMFEVVPTLLAPTEDPRKMGPGKIFFRNERNPTQRAIVPIEVPNGIAPLAGIVQQFENNADEVSAVPRYMTGENATQGAAGTSSGLSMLMGAVNIVIKDLVGNADTMTTSFLVSLYRWNMQFHNDDSIKGDYDPHANGTASLVAKEVRARQLNEFGALTANPLDAPFIKRGRLNQLRAEASELIDVVKTDDEVAAEMNNPATQAQAQMQQAMQQLEVAEREAKVALTQAQTAKLGIDSLLVQAKTVDTKLESVFAALQAAGIAVGNPRVAPAGDEILRSAGWEDATPDPSIAQLGGPPVQTDASMGMPMPGTANPQSPRVGARAGIETARIEDVA
jgi:hypothetical protein